MHVLIRLSHLRPLEVYSRRCELPRTSAFVRQPLTVTIVLRYRINLEKSVG